MQRTKLPGCETPDNLNDGPFSRNRVVCRFNAASARLHKFVELASTVVGRGIGTNVRKYGLKKCMHTVGFSAPDGELYRLRGEGTRY